MYRICLLLKKTFIIYCIYSSNDVKKQNYFVGRQKFDIMINKSLGIAKYNNNVFNNLILIDHTYWNIKNKR